MRRAFWLEELAEDLQATEPLNHNTHADIAIIGGGYVGLWTALQILDKSPESNVVILEKDICGGGASGRNGGFVMSWWSKINSLIASCGQHESIRLAVASAENIREIGQFCDSYKIDAHFQQKGWLWTATTKKQRGAWESVVRCCEQLGHDIFQRLSCEEVKSRTGSVVHLEGVFDPDVATVQPARLVRGLRRVALERGIRIFENTQVTSFDRQQPVTLNTPNGRVMADRVVVANNVWATEIPELSRFIVPVTSTVVMSEKIPERLKNIGWTGGEGITDSQLMVDYYRTTVDGRIAFGKGVGTLAFGAKMGPEFDFSARDSKAAEADLRRVYPMLADVKIEYSWSGPIDRTYDSLPLFGTLPGSDNIFYGIGWSGNGVGPSRIGGKILSSLALGLKDEWSQCGLVERKVRQFPPEPLRYVGGNIVRAAVARKEQAEVAGRQPNRLDVVLSRFAPAGLEDKDS
jgi:putative aminophosphonate oxidoreductase